MTEYLLLATLLNPMPMQDFLEAKKVFPNRAKLRKLERVVNPTKLQKKRIARLRAKRKEYQNLRWIKQAIELFQNETGIYDLTDVNIEYNRFDQNGRLSGGWGRCSPANNQRTIWINPVIRPYVENSDKNQRIQRAAFLVTVLHEMAHCLLNLAHVPGNQWKYNVMAPTSFALIELFNADKQPYLDHLLLQTEKLLPENGFEPWPLVD